MPEPDDAGQDDPTSLGAQLRRAIEELTDRGPTQWLAENAIDEDGNPVLKPSTATHILRESKRTGWMTPSNVRAVARAIRWPHSRIYVPNAVEIGLDPPPGRSDFSESLPPGIDQLSDAGKDSLRTMAWVLCRAEGVAK
jgi:hypothetical protein